MARFEAVVGGWSDLVTQLEHCGTIKNWEAAEPELFSMCRFRDLPVMVTRDADRSTIDGVLAALVRLAARDGGGDAQAALVVVHLLREGVEGLARRFRHRGPDVLAVVVGELVCRIRTFPWRTSRPYPARLLLDTKHALWTGEFRPIVDGRRPHDAFLLDPIGLQEYANPADEPDDIDLIDLFSWAASSGVVSVDDLRLLVALEQHRGYGNQTLQSVADEWGINERTVRRRRDRALAGLRAATGAYLSAVA